MVDINSSILRFRQQERADTLANFNTRNEVLAVGEVAFIIDENKVKVGDGVTPFQSLSFLTTDIAEVAQSVVPNIEVDKIDEATTDQGVNVEGVTLKDGDITATGGQVALTSTQPFLNFRINDGETTHNNLRFVATSSSLQIQIRDDGNNFVSNDYLIDRDENGAIKHTWRIGNVDKLVIDGEGNTSIKGLAEAEQGISFDGGVNTLEHYEEGVFTPQYQFVDEPSYVQQVGQYTRVGNILYFRLMIEISSIDNTDTSNVHIGGLPYNAFPRRVINASLNTNESNILSSYFANKESIYFDVINSVSAILLQDKEGQYIKYTDISNSGKISITGWYFV